MTTTAYYKQLVLRLCSACNTGDVRAVEELLTPDFVDIGGVDEARGADGVQGFLARLAGIRRVFTDFRWEVLGLVAEGTTVILRLRLSGSRGDSVHSMEQVHIYEGRDGRIASRTSISGRGDMATAIELTPTTVRQPWLAAVPS